MKNDYEKQNMLIVTKDAEIKRLKESIKELQAEITKKDKLINSVSL